MAKIEETALEILRERAWRKVETFGDLASKEALPVQLDQFARATNIQRIRFERLMSVAGLAKLHNGFEIVVNTEADGVNQAAGTLVDLDRWASTVLDSSLRFTVAHEIAHAIVLAAHEGDWGSDVFRKNQRAIENTCNQMAAALLMPRRHLEREVGLQAFHASHLVAIAGKFGVSCEAFVRRLKQSDIQSAFVNLHGFLAFLSKESGGFGIVCSHVSGDFAHKRFDSFFDSDNSDKDEDGESSLPRADGLLKTFRTDDLVSWFDSGDNGQREVRILYHSGEGSTVPCDVSFCQVHGFGTRLLFCVQMTEPPQKA